MDEICAAHFIRSIQTSPGDFNSTQEMFYKTLIPSVHFSCPFLNLSLPPQRKLLTGTMLQRLSRPSARCRANRTRDAAWDGSHSAYRTEPSAQLHVSKP